MWGMLNDARSMRMFSYIAFVNFLFILISSWNHEHDDFYTFIVLNIKAYVLYWELCDNTNVLYILDGRLKWWCNNCVKCDIFSKGSINQWSMWCLRILLLYRSCRCWIRSELVHVQVRPSERTSSHNPSWIFVGNAPGFYLHTAGYLQSKLWHIFHCNLCYNQN